MEKGKAFLHERVIYEYLLYRANKMKRLKLRWVIENGKNVAAKKYVNVTYINIQDTKFPDISNIQIKTKKGSIDCPAEVKFLASEYDYHLVDKGKNKIDYSDFMSKGGCIVVLVYDFEPIKLFNVHTNVNIFEIDLDDFKTFVLENFERLLYKQLHKRLNNSHKIWLFSQVGNFNGERLEKVIKERGIKPARESGIWSPTQKLTPYDLSTNDKVIFIKFRGSKSNLVQKRWKLNYTLPVEWNIAQIYIGKIISPIMTRNEYLESEKLQGDPYLWPKEVKDKKRNWELVFKFSKIMEVDCKVSIERLNINLGPVFTNKLVHVFTQQKAIELDIEEYNSFIEYIFYEQSIMLEKELEKSLQLQQYNNELNNHLIQLEKNLENTNYIIQDVIINNSSPISEDNKYTSY